METNVESTGLQRSTRIQTPGHSFPPLPSPSFPSRRVPGESAASCASVWKAPRQKSCVRLPACEQVRRLGCGAARVTGRRSRCRPSFPDDVIMGRDSWQLRFLSAQISRDINNEWHGRATSAAAQRAHDCSSRSPALPLSLCVLIPFFFFFHLPRFISIPSPLLFIFSFSFLIRWSYGEYQSFPPTQMHLYFIFIHFFFFLLVFSLA